MPYDLDATETDEAHSADDRANAGDRGGIDQRASASGDGGEDPTDRLADAFGVTVPEEHVGAFVAEAFEDAERDTDWGDVVDEFVPEEARDAWAELRPRDRAQAVLDAAASFDEEATETLEAVPLDASADRGAVEAQVEEALRLRRNADTFRDGVAAAYADGRLDDDALVAAVADSGFADDAVARRESALETVADVHDVDFRPYGGRLFDADEGPDPDVDHDASETW